MPDVSSTLPEPTTAVMTAIVTLISFTMMLACRLGPNALSLFNSSHRKGDSEADHDETVTMQTVGEVQEVADQGHQAEAAEVNEEEQPHTAAPAAMPDFPYVGITVDGLEHFARLHAGEITAASTTSDVCHTVIKPITVPIGWIDVATLFDAKKGWYSHQYKNRATGVMQQIAPAGTMSYCEKLKVCSATAHFVGKSTVFLSHAWSFCFLNVLAALRDFVDSQPAGSPPMYFWFDTFSIDEHATQTLPQEWWSTTFLEAVRMIGHTVMMLSPWNHPIPLTRAWCLWELYATVLVGGSFSVCLGPAERQKFETALIDDFDVVMTAFAGIVRHLEAPMFANILDLSHLFEREAHPCPLQDVRDAEAGSPDDQVTKTTEAS